jgi:hypothetical protein
MKRYIYKSGLDIIAPLKCGTRWLEGFDVENRIKTFGLHATDLPNHIHSGTTFIWRPVREHFYSALKTELSIHSEKSPFDVVTEMESGICDHWYPYLYKELYTIWSQNPFRFHKLRALSSLTPNAKELEYSTTMYKFALPTEWDNVEDALNTLSPKHIIRLEKLISEEEKWLKKMLKPQYSKKSWEEYSDLEDSNLEIKCRVKDMETEVKLINETLVNQLQLQRINNSELTNGLYTKIEELKQQNKKLQSKLDYTESVIGKLPKKLI